MPDHRSLRLTGFVPYRVSVAASDVSDLIASAYRARFGLSIPEWRVMAVLAEQPDINQFRVCSATFMDKLAVSRAAIRLVDRGLVTRAPHPHDRRSSLLRLSAAGHALYEKVVPTALALEHALISGFAPGEIDQLLSLLQRLQQAAALVRSQA